MKVDLKGSVFVITGKLTKMNRYDAEAAIERVGGKTADSVTKKTDYLIVGERPSSKYTKARNMGIPILTEDDFKALIAGEAVEVEAIGEAGDRSVSELLGEVRSVMQGSPSAQMWSELIKLLDACRADDVDVLTDYIDSYIARWSDEQMRGLVGSSLDKSDTKDERRRWWWYYRSNVEGELRVAPEHWVGEMQQGIDSPKYKVVRALELTATKMTSTAISKIMAHPSLSHLEVLTLPESLAPSKGLIKSLCSHATVKHLQLGKIDEKTGGAFLEYGGEPTQLETFDMTRLDVKYGMRTADEICEFATAPYFSTVTSLHLAGGRYYDRMFLEKMERGEALQNVEHMHFDVGYNIAPFLSDLLATSWAGEHLKKITARRLSYGVDERIQQSWIDVLNSDFKGHLEVLDLSSFDLASSAGKGAPELRAMLHRVLPTANLLAHLDTLILGELKTTRIAEDLAKAFPDLTVQ